MLVGGVFLSVDVFAVNTNYSNLAGFRTEFSNSYAMTESSILLKNVSASIENGNLVFTNNRYDAVEAFIHDADGKVVKRIIIPGKSDGYFTSALDSVFSLPGELVSARKPKIIDHLQKGPVFELKLNDVNDYIPNGGSISYVSGTDKARAATYLNALLAGITKGLSVVDGSDSKEIKKVFLDIGKAALEDQELITNILYYSDAGEFSQAGSKLIEWLGTKGRTELIKSGSEIVHIPLVSSLFKKVTDVKKTLKSLESESKILDVLSIIRDARLEDKPRVLWFDLPYDDNEGGVLQNHIFDWSGTELAYRDKLLWSPVKQSVEDESNWKFWKWDDKFDAMYARFTKISSSDLILPAAPREPDPSLAHKFSLASMNNSHMGSAYPFYMDNTPTYTSEDAVKGFKDSLIATNGIGGKSTNTNPVQTGQQQSMFVNTQPFSSTDWIVKEGASNNFVKTNSFGSVVAPENKQMAALNNANMSHTVMERTFTVPTGVKNVSLGFNANFITNEFPAFVGSQFNDNVKVEVITASGNSYDIKTPFKESLNASQLQPVTGLPNPMMADGGQTGFKPVDVTNIPVAGGGAVTVRVTVENVGDQLYPSAALISDTQAKPR